MIKVIVMALQKLEDFGINQRSEPKTLEKWIKSKLNAIWDLIENFCIQSGIEGLRYFADPNRHWFERILWCFAVALSFSVCAYFIADIWHKRVNYPVTVTYDDKISTIGSIPFPAVTICPPNRVSAQKFNLSHFIEKYADNYPNSFRNASTEEKIRFSAALQVCSSDLRLFYARDEANVNRTEIIPEIIQDIALKRKDVFSAIMWLGSPIKRKRFKTVLTERGPCYTFNMLNSRSIYTNITAQDLFSVRDNPDEGSWNMESELLKLSLPEEQRSSIPPVYPHYISRIDDVDSLTLKLNFVPDDFYWNYDCDGPLTKSYKVYLHRPDEIKEAFDRPFEVEIGRKVIASITPNVISASQDVRKYSSHLRQCFFNSERQLRFFKVYTKSNCEHECLANFTRNYCGCVKFVMPRDRQTGICDVNQLPCYSAAVNMQRQMRYGNDTAATFYLDKCNCLPSCVDITYETQISELKYINPNDDQSSNITTFLTLSFKNNEFLVLKRSEMYPVTNLFSTCGGLLSLFMGISLLGITELIVQFAIRLIHKCLHKTKTYTYPYTS